MEDKDYLPIEQMEVFRRFVDVADWVWDVVVKWSPLAQDTVGKQLIRAADSVGANLVEGDGRATDPDAVHFFVIARASAREARYWINRAIRRALLAEEIGESKIAELTGATQLLNRLIGYRRSSIRQNKVRETRAMYTAADQDPFVGRCLNARTPERPNA